MPDSAFLITAFVTLFVVVDPIGLAPLFAALTQGMSTGRRRRIALTACAVAMGILVLFTLLGEAVLGFVGISMPAFRIAGGLLLFLTALEMLFERRSKRREDRNEDEVFNDPSVFPLGIPLIAGPGSIATVILLAGEAPGWPGTASIIGLSFAVVCLVFAMFSTAGPMERLLGRTGINVVTRVLGMLLAALSVQFVLDGLSAYWGG
ncbi:MarC family protein [Pseudaestuariivita atlantica]|uniref:UPF0056 membrane protein n=1 Tax=Pseudaestuariivita atlantica TaxID=1317121 RepID=A0A0L1JME3_9RHOB|nr:MarC family protein [Pseudaestuariivita atlantica]KNG92892.1 MarC family transcriptional regulator [Pseudaestuariivita atlantica]